MISLTKPLWEKTKGAIKEKDYDYCTHLFYFKDNGY